jgi:hypothetical protein
MTAESPYTAMIVPFAMSSPNMTPFFPYSCIEGIWESAMYMCGNTTSAQARVLPSS